MRAVIPDILWIGTSHEARDLQLIAETGIEAIVDLASRKPMQVLLKDVINLRIPIIDGDGNRPERLRLAVMSVLQLLRENIPTLVACNRGMSRSPAVAAYALARLRYITPLEAAELIGGSISPELWSSLDSAMQVPE
jgi:protein-tyrosine phosphatase